MAGTARNVCHRQQERDYNHRHVSLAIVHNLHEVPPVPGHFSRQDNHSSHKWVASTRSARRPAVGGASKRGGIIPAGRRRAGMSPRVEVTRSHLGIRCGVWARAVDTVPRQIADEWGGSGSRAQHRGPQEILYHY